MSVIIPVDLDLADFEPKRREISNVTQAAAAVVTTTEDHLYSVGLDVRLHVEQAFDMVLDGVEATITAIPTTTTFTTDVDTSELFAYNTPTFPRSTSPQGFTQSHVVPITGDVKNVSGPLTG